VVVSVATAELLAGYATDGRLFTGAWTDAPATIDVVEPATGDVLGAAGVADADTVSRAAASAAQAQREWAAAQPTERAAVLRRAAELLGEHRAELERWIVRETGSVRSKAEIEIRQSIDHLLVAAGLLGRPLGEMLPSAFPGRASFARRVPVGVVGVISPWNFPVILSMRSVAPALALGNAVLVKPDAETPITGGVLVARVFEEAGLPEGVLHVLPGGADVGQAIASDPNVSMIAFTGSTATGRAVAETAGRTLKRVMLELGGNSPLIVLDDADIELASSAGAFGSFLHQGQVCMAVSRHLVHESIADAYVEALATRAARLPVGNPDTEEVALGPIINARQLDRIQSVVDGTVAAGATVVVGGQRDDPYYPPTVLRDVAPGTPAYEEEIFGPVAPVTTFRDDAEAVELANSTEYGLAAAVQTGSRERGDAIAAQLRAGMVHVNDQTVNEESAAPFGGPGATGSGFCGGSANLEAFTRWQWLTSRDRAAPFPF